MENIEEVGISAKSAIKFLYGLERFGIKSGLSNITALLNFAGRPQDHFPAVHIAGTNGKGSTAAMIASVLTASGYRTGLYTSPHLRNFSERIRINGQKISASSIAQYARFFRSKIISRKATFFEATTGIAFKYFSDQSVDVAVIETGLGGRLDATNVLLPELTIITDIGIDHTEYLGKTIKEIAFEKGGIIKPGVVCMTTADHRIALGELRRIARQRRSRLVEIKKNASEHVTRSGLDGIELDISILGNILRDLKLSFCGVHQIRNLRGSLTALYYLSEKGIFSKVDERSIRKGLSEIVKNTGLRGRMDAINFSPLVIVDVAHNPGGISVLTRGLKQLVPGRYIVVFGVMSDKNYNEMVRIMAPFARVLIATAPRTKRALTSGEIVACAQDNGIRAVKGLDTADSLKIALSEVRSGEAILVTGSHYVAGEAFEYFKIIP